MSVSTEVIKKNLDRCYLAYYSNDSHQDKLDRYAWFFEELQDLDARVIDKAFKAWLADKDNKKFPRPCDIRNTVFAGGDNPAKGENGDFEPYKRAFIYASFRLSGEEPENFERIDREIERFSSYLANNRVIEFKAPDGRMLKRYLILTEYEEISNLRTAAGTGRLRPFADVKYGEEIIEPDSDKIRGILETAGEVIRINEKDLYDENEYNPEF